MGMTHRGPYDDSGIALAIVMSAIALMVLLATGAFFVASQTLVDTQLATRHDAAFQAASSGVVVAFTGIRSQVASGTTPPSPLVITGSVAASYTAVTTFNAATNSYDCTSTGTAPGGITEVVVATFAINLNSSPGMTYGSDVFYFGGYTAGSINGVGDIAGPFFALFPPQSPFLSITLGGNETVQSGPLYIVNGNLVLHQKDAPQPVVVYTNGTIAVKNQPVTTQGFRGRIGGTNFYQQSLADTATLSVTTVNTATFLPQALASATTQSTDNIRGDTLPGDAPFPNQEVASYGGTAYKVIGNSLTIDGTRSFGSISTTNPTDVHDDFACDGHGTLYVEGTVYVSGNLTISGTIKYVGNGTIVCTGSATLSGGGVTPSGGVVDKRHLLCVFTAGDLSIVGNKMPVYGAFYAVGSLKVPGNNPDLQGSFATEKGIDSAGNGVSITPLPGIAGFVSPGLPNLVSIAGTTTTDLKMTSWRRL